MAWTLSGLHAHVVFTAQLAPSSLPCARLAPAPRSGLHVNVASSGGPCLTALAEAAPAPPNMSC